MAAPCPSVWRTGGQNDIDDRMTWQDFFLLSLSLYECLSKTSPASGKRNHLKERIPKSDNNATVKYKSEIFGEYPNDDERSRKKSKRTWNEYGIHSLNIVIELEIYDKLYVCRTCQNIFQRSRERELKKIVERSALVLT